MPETSGTEETASPEPRSASTRRSTQVLQHCSPAEVVLFGSGARRLGSRATPSSGELLVAMASAGPK